MSHSNIKNVKDLRNALVDKFQKLEAKEIGVKEAGEFSKNAGQIVQSLKTEIEYRKLTGNNTKIDFLEY